MAIISTGAIYKSLVFDGEDSRDYGVYITGQAVYNAPERDVEMINIPGRNGSFALDKGRFQNIEVTYPAGIFADNETDFAQGISDFRNFLCSRNGYVRLTDDYNPDEYRMAVYKEGLEVDEKVLRAGEFDITFDCKPQRYLTSGEEPITIGEWHETETASGSIVTFDAEETDAVKSLTCDIDPIQDLHGYDKPWSGGAGKNKMPPILTQGSASIVVFGQDNNTDFDIGLKAGTYTISVQVSKNVNFYMQKSTDSGSTHIGNYNVKNATFTLESDADIRIWAYVADGLSVSDISTVQLEQGSTATAYEPYSNICPISGHDEVNVSVCGVNVWDEEWEEGAISSSTGQPYSGTGVIRSKNFCKCLPSTTYYVKTTSNNQYIFWYDADENFISSAQVSNATITSPSNAYNFKIQTRTDYGGTYKNDISINYPSTDTSYHAYNGTTYVTDLNGTVYGGTVDVVSGVLTVDRVKETYEWSEGTGATTLGDYTRKVFKTSYASVRQYSGDNVQICDCLTWLHSYVTQSPHFYVDTGNAGANNCVVVMPSTITSQTINIVYGLATPTTVQLTAQEVELLVGQNNVWNDCGDTTVEYGLAPNILINPTLFESSPMLEVEGYGTVGFNGYEIELADTRLGDIELGTYTYAANARRYTFDEAKVNDGDAMYFGGSTPSYFAHDITRMNSNITVTGAVIVESTNCEQQVQAYSSFVFWKEVPDLSAGFVVGTPSAITWQAKCTVTYKVSGTAYSVDITHNNSLSYDGSNTIVYTYSESYSVTNAPFILHPDGGLLSLYANSTVDALGHPTYIDCDLGEAYMIKDGSVISLNQYIDLGSDLPVLAVGDTEITFNNTVTDLKVVPRWWKV